MCKPCSSWPTIASAIDLRDEAVVDVLFVQPKNRQPVAPESEQLYHAICGGRLLALPRLIAAAHQAGAMASAEG